MNILAKRIEKIRNEAGLTQKEFADLTKTHRSTVSRWESGSSEPKPRHLVKIAAIAGITVDQLLADLDSNPALKGGVLLKEVA